MPEKTMTVRIAGTRDLDAVDALLARSYPRLLAADYPPSVLVTAIPIIARAQPELLRSGTYYVVEDTGGQIIGAGGWTLWRAGQPVADVRHVASDPDHLRRGVGRALMGRIVHDARRAGVTRMQCKSTLTAVPFYRSVGFRVLGGITVPLRPGIDFPAIAMQRDL